jgi:CRP/FNR family transcriptional regulator
MASLALVRDFPEASCEPERCAGCSIRSLGLCEPLDTQDISQLHAIASTRRLSAGEYFTFEGDAVSACASVVSGTAKLTKTFEDGRMQIVGLAFPGDFIQTGDETGTGEARVGVEAIDSLVLCTFPSREFEQLRMQSPQLEHRLLELTRKELASAREWMRMLGRMSASERVSAFVLYLAERAHERGETHFTLPLTRSEIADFTGLTLETVSRQFSRLRRDGVLTASSARNIDSYSLEQLRERAGI